MEFDNKIKQIELLFNAKSISFAELKYIVFTLNQALIKYPILFLFLLVSFMPLANAQKTSKSRFNVGADIGISRMMAEIPNGFTNIINEFDNKAGFAWSVEISKYISPRWETGIDAGNSLLRGVSYNPRFTAEGFQSGIPIEIIEPVDYRNNLYNANLLVRYYFKPAEVESSFIPYVSGGVGLMYYRSKLTYFDAPDEDPIFGKGIRGQTNLVTPVFNLGTGFKTSLSEQCYLMTSLDFRVVNYDFLDVMHNYNPGGGRLELVGLFSELKIGIYYSVGFGDKGKNPAKHRKTRYRKATKPVYMPFR